MVKRDFIKNVILIVLLFLQGFVLYTWVIGHVSITSDMQNSYLHEADWVTFVRNARLNHGDFILYRHEGKEYVSRVIALEDEKVTYMDDVLYRDEMIVPEKYLNLPDSQETYTDDFTLETLTDGAYDQIPKGHYLVLNDVRTNRQDSRRFGLIPQKEVIGRLTLRVLPLDDFGFIETGLAQ